MLNRRAYLCPKCHQPSTLFSTKTSARGVIYRIRMCGTCKYMYRTVEMIDKEEEE